MAYNKRRHFKSKGEAMTPTPEEINKYLTEAMGECWHEWDKYTPIWSMKKNIPEGKAFTCSECDLHVRDLKDGGGKRNDYFTWQGYGKAREFYDGFDRCEQLDFQDWLVKRCEAGLVDGSLLYREILLHAFHKDNLARLMYEFLGEK